jgi:hypothetical protein
MTSKAALSRPGASADGIDLTPEAVRARFDWATRQGQPMWLWPGVKIHDWHDALNAIEQVLRATLTGRQVTTLSDGDPEAIGIACYTSGVGPLLGFWLEQVVMTASPPVAEVLERHLRHNRLRMDRLSAEAVALATALTSAGVGVTVLKGLHTARYFPEPGTRPVSDIDLLVAGRDEQALASIMRALGYEPGLFSRGPPPQQEWRLPDVPVEPRSLCFVHADDPWSVDVQTSLNRRYSSGAPMISLDDALAGGARSPWSPVLEAEILAQPLLLLQLAVHASCGFQSLNMLRLVELALIVRRDVTEGLLSWDAFLALAEQLEALGLIYPALRLCEMLVPGTIPAEVMARCARRTPAAVRHVVDRLTPANAQRVVRYSIAEKFMWSSSRLSILRQLLSDVVPPGLGSASGLLGAYRKRAWKIARQTLSR